MRDLILRFPHVAEQIFQQLNNEDLAKSREVERLWQKFIDERNYPWLRIVNIPTILQDGDTYMHLAAQCGQTDMFEMILDKEENKNAKNCNGETPFLVACSKGRMNIALTLLKKYDELKIDFNVKDNDGRTAFHLACLNGHSEIAEMILKNSSNLKIDLNSKDFYDRTAFYAACNNGHSEIAEMIMKNSSELEIDLNSKENDGQTAFHVACAYGHSEIAEMIMKKSSALKINLNVKDKYGCTAFHLACMYGHIRIVDMIIEQSDPLKLDLKAVEDSNGKTGFQMARKCRRTDVVNLIQTKMPSLSV